MNWQVLNLPNRPKMKNMQNFSLTIKNDSTVFCLVFSTCLYNLFNPMNQPFELNNH